MSALLANTIWFPLFVYRYDTVSALISFAIGFIAECCVFRIYTRDLLPLAATVRRLALANLASYLVGYVALIFLPFTIHKISFWETAVAFFAAYLVTLPVEYWVLRPLLPSKTKLLLRAVIMSNFVSYSILFAGYVIWFSPPSILKRYFAFGTAGFGST